MVTKNIKVVSNIVTFVVDFNNKKVISEGVKIQWSVLKLKP